MMNKELQTYKDLCTQYYDLDKPFLPQDEWDFYYAYAQAAQGPILEPMCGTGRFLIPLVQAGFSVEGFDASDYMLDKLHRNAQEAGVTPHVWKAFVEDVNIVNRYNLIFIPAGSLNLITDRNAVTKSLKALYAALVPGGTFVFELISIDFIQQVKTGIVNTSSVYRPDGMRITIVSTETPLVDGVSGSVCRYMLMDGAEIVATETEEYALRFYTDVEINMLLATIGFRQIKRMKAFVQGAEPDPGDMVVMYECKK